MAGNEKGGIVSSVMAGVAFAVGGDGVGFATESYAASALYPSGALLRIRRVKLKKD
ncbi:alcohol dehydrogenase zinc-binding domain protein (plasmid) [Bradyrhizobium diazoefficiens]|uniref:Alcohol dehydrogenase zinc-binding domain protein n=1 Tax=Bradyrhizobium diazoefficiens TaxID=1355477 RepID=A0A0E4FZT1_9BRAD|nr:alcohol dehydrogenase zinc-binding domain protein [Bradyrhizobium diazoefficiens]BAR63514.1 alcohol dehydrogenase zinc-binding domain protein [Bradyrhizobium diazoefficiens]